ncbi:tetratricopeptide repeat protein [Waterburya agarophytonicola K14]|uniref:Tetratricopeptide repeat protein n=1 Tax=Waterburya agarophytonicola KI4 TaxID=2874699 RepID=A0A964BL57_9CYAN|nr:tetratricopeptide repeat protein [Waterburya agarophytonicola]MCC0175413.1 tetratricopeptide repeat protein [Waterburya agarophytonicola KI4]
MKESSLSPLNPTQVQKAIAKCTEKIANEPKSASMHADLGHLYLQQKKWQAAKNSYEEAIKIDPEFAEAHGYLAEIWTHLDNPYKAADSLDLAFKLKPNSATARQHHELAKTLQEQNKPGRAISAYRRGIKINPGFLSAYRSLGKFFFQREEYQQAIALYRQGVAQNPQNPRFHLALGQALADLEKWFQAIESYQTVAQLNPNLPELYCYWGQALVKIDRTAQAEEFYKKAIALKADYWQAYYQLGVLWQKQQKWSPALLAYRKVRSIEPNRVNILNKMAVVYRHLQQYDLAIACHREAIKISPESSPSENTAIAAYQKTLAIYPHVTIQHHYQQAKLLRAKGRFVEAIAAYQKTIELDPQFKLAYIDLQYIPIAKDRLDELIEFYRGIVAQNPNITIAWGNLGDALSQQNRVPEAIECYRKGSYEQAIQKQPHLTQLTWKEKQESGPDFIIAGASKSGTSSIYYYLGCHPQVLLSHKKEIDFYWKNFQRGIDWYLAHFPTITDRPDFLTGEATPNYLRFPEVARRIKQTFPKTKIIILLRNPADRAISWHYHKFNTGLTNVDLTTAISEEMKRLKTVTEKEIIETGFYNPDNILSSLYIYKLKPWIEILGREQFLILKSEDFYQNPALQMKQVWDFLGLPNYDLEQYPKVNGGSYNEVDSSLRKTLIEYFAPYNQQLEEYLGVQFNWQ